jgi:hypothetical protein
MVSWSEWTAVLRPGTDHDWTWLTAPCSSGAPESSGSVPEQGSAIDPELFRIPAVRMSLLVRWDQHLSAQPEQSLLVQLLRKGWQLAIRVDPDRVSAWGSHVATKSFEFP